MYECNELILSNLGKNGIGVDVWLSEPSPGKLTFEMTVSSHAVREFVYLFNVIFSVPGAA